MGFDLDGQAPTAPSGEYFYNTVWGWRPLERLIVMTCADILTKNDLRGLGFNDGYAYSERKARAIAKRLRDIALDDQRLADYEAAIMATLSDSYKGCFSKQNVLDFVEFLESSGGFRVC